MYKDKGRNVIRKYLCTFLPRSPEVYTDEALGDASEDEIVDGDCVGEMLDLHKRSTIEAQSIEKHDVRLSFLLKPEYLVNSSSDW